MVNERYSKAMAETLHYLKGISQYDIKKIPNKFMQFLEENALQYYECNFDYTKPLKELDLMDETRGIISMICLNYWCETEEEKDNFIKHLNENDIRYQEELIKKYDINNIFEKKNSRFKNENISKHIDINNLPIKVEQENIIKRIFNYIKGFFNKKRL